MWTTLISGILMVVGVLAGLFALIWWLGGLTAALATFFVLTCLLMTLVVLIQKPRGGGLAGAFGGAAGAPTGVFGAKVGDALTYITVGLFVLFLGLGMGLVYATRSDALPKPLKATQPEPVAPAAGDLIPPDLPVTPATPAPAQAVPDKPAGSEPAPAVPAPALPPSDGGAN